MLKNSLALVLGVAFALIPSLAFAEDTDLQLCKRRQALGTKQFAEELAALKALRDGSLKNAERFDREFKSYTEEAVPRLRRLLLGVPELRAFLARPGEGVAEVPSDVLAGVKRLERKVEPSDDGKFWVSTSQASVSETLFAISEADGVRLQVHTEMKLVPAAKGRVVLEVEMSGSLAESSEAQSQKFAEKRLFVDFESGVALSDNPGSYRRFLTEKSFEQVDAALRAPEAWVAKITWEKGLPEACRVLLLEDQLKQGAMPSAPDPCQSAP